MAASNSLNMDEAGVQTFNSTTGNLIGSAITQYNVIVGDINNKLTNVAPSSTSGIPLVSAGSSTNPAFGTAVVAGGGSGNTTFTAYSVICAGTSPTGAFQNVSGLGSSTQALISNGASALPTWQTQSGGSGALVVNNSTANGNPADATTYFLSNALAITDAQTATSNGSNRYYIPVTGTITRVYGSISCTVGSAQSTTISVRLNNTTNTVVSNTLNLSAATVTFNNTALSISVAQGDFINLLLICPTWTSNPTNVNISITLYIAI